MVVPNVDPQSLPLWVNTVRKGKVVVSLGLVVAF
jgi:hypothetical protein